MKRALLFTIALLGAAFLATGSSYATATLVLGPLSGNPVANFDPALLTQTSEDKPVDAPDDLHAELIDKDGNSVWKIEPVESETDEAESESADETEAGSETEEETVQAPDGVAPAEVEVQQIPPGKYTLYVEQASTGLFGATEVVIEECQKCAEEDAEDEGCDECKERRRRERAIIFFLSPKGLKELKGIHLCDGHMGQDCHCDEHCVCRYFDHFCTPAVSPCGETFKNRGSNNNPPRPQQPNANPSSPQTPPQTPPTPGMGGFPWGILGPVAALPRLINHGPRGHHHPHDYNPYTPRPVSPFPSPRIPEEEVPVEELPPEEDPPVVPDPPVQDPPTEDPPVVPDPPVQDPPNEFKENELPDDFEVIDESPSSIMHSVLGDEKYDELSEVIEGFATVGYNPGDDTYYGLDTERNVWIGFYTQLSDDSDDGSSQGGDEDD